MKKISYILLCFMLVSTAATKVAAQGESRQVSGFSAVASAGSFNVHISMGSTESVRVDADDDVIKDIETVVEGNTLKIRFKDRNYHRNIHKAEVYVTARSLSALTNSGSGSIKVDGTINAGDFKVTLSGSGNISTAVKSEDVHGVISGSGSIKLSGNTGDASFVITGSGEIEGKGLRTSATNVVITGSGNVYVAAEKSVSAHITGSGSVIYTGNASVVDTRYTGSGRVSKDD